MRCRRSPRAVGITLAELILTSFRSLRIEIPAAFGPDGLTAFVATDEFDVPVITMRRLPPQVRALMRYLGFEERVRGSHHLFDKEGVVEIVNLQSRGGHAKPYQVRQVRRLILKYKLGADD